LKSETEPYDLRPRRGSTWLNEGVPSTQVAERAGQSIEVLLVQIYANCLDGEKATLRRRIEDALGLTGDVLGEFGKLAALRP
jgi:hypothetical protein